jgi:DAPG hydrolase PhiG domain
MSVERLPARRPVLWPLRPQDSARVSRSDDGGRRVVTIEHAALTGVTAEMLTWWYGHVPGTMPYADGMYPRYLVWHPLDHISYEVENNGAVVGGTSWKRSAAISTACSTSMSPWSASTTARP